MQVGADTGIASPSQDKDTFPAAPVTRICTFPPVIAAVTNGAGGRGQHIYLTNMIKPSNQSMNAKAALPP